MIEGGVGDQHRGSKWGVLGGLLCFMLHVPLLMSASGGWFVGYGWLEECHVEGGTPDGIPLPLNITCTPLPGSMRPLGLTCFSATFASALAMVAIVVLGATRPGRHTLSCWIAICSAALVATSGFAFVAAGVLLRGWERGWVAGAACLAVAMQLMLAFGVASGTPPRE